MPLPSKLPRSTRLPTRSSPDRVMLLPAATVTALPSARRLALASVSRPPSIDTVPAFELPANVLLPDEVSVPVPRLALAVPPASA